MDATVIAECVKTALYESLGLVPCDHVLHDPADQSHVVGFLSAQNSDSEFKGSNYP